MSFPRYPAYKDSGVDWLGPIPATWNVCALKRIASLQSGESITSEQIEADGTYPVYGGNGLRGYCEAHTHDGEFALIGRQGALCGNINYARGKFWASEHAVVVTPKLPVATQWLGELLRAMNLNQYSVSAAQPGLSVEIVGNLGIPLPSREEQKGIAAFLDRETAKIDALVAEQEDLITLLKEKRQAVISHAVTKGLDPSVPMKDSGIEWLGKVPAHWSVQPLGTLTRDIQTGPFGSQLHSDEYVDDATPVINPSNIIDGQLCPEPSATVTDEVVERLAHHRLIAGDIVVGRRGEMGRCAVVTQSQAGWLCGTGCLKIQLNSTALPEFVWRYLATETIKQYLSLQSVGSTMENLNTQILARVPVPVPNATEQAAICEAVSDQLKTLAALESEAITGVRLLQARRAALIYAAVTGQIDVRALAPTQEHAA